MKIRTLSLAIATGLAALSASAQDASIDKTRTSLQEWVETRQIIAKEKADWTLLKQTLIDTKELLSTQQTQLEEKLKELEESKTAADDEREKLMAENAELKAATDVLKAKVSEIEVNLLAIIPSFPETLQDAIDPLMRRIPKPGSESKASLGERVQNIVGILSQAEKFNGKISLVNRTQALPDGREVQVSTLYWGLGQAYFVDTTGTYAGVGFPTSEGWVYEEVAGFAPDVNKLISIYEGEATDVTFIPVPASIK